MRIGSNTLRKMVLSVFSVFAIIIAYEFLTFERCMFDLSDEEYSFRIVEHKFPIVSWFYPKYTSQFRSKPDSPWINIFSDRNQHIIEDNFSMSTNCSGNISWSPTYNFFTIYLGKTKAYSSDRGKSWRIVRLP